PAAPGWGGGAAGCKFSEGRMQADSRNDRGARQARDSRGAGGRHEPSPAEADLPSVRWRLLPAGRRVTMPWGPHPLPDSLRLASVRVRRVLLPLYAQVDQELRLPTGRPVLWGARAPRVNDSRFRGPALAAGGPSPLLTQPE